MFVKTTRGQLNVAFLKWVKDRRTDAGDGDTRRGWIKVAVDNDGEEYRLDDYMGALDDAFYPTTIVPNILPLTLIEISFDAEADDPDEPIVVCYPIIAWRVGQHGYPDPLALGCGTDFSMADCPMFIELSCGKFQQVGYEAGLYDDFDACIAAVREYHARGK